MDLPERKPGIKITTSGKTDPESPDFMVYPGHPGIDMDSRID